MTRTFEAVDRPLPALISLAFTQVSTSLMARVRAAGFEDLRLHHFLNVFRFMEPDGTRPARLAEMAGITPQAMSLVLVDLERLGYLQREPDPADRRSQLVTWSARGLAAGAVTEQWFADVEAHWAAITGAEDVAAARRVLTHVVEEQS